MQNRLATVKTSITFKIKKAIQHKNILIFLNKEKRDDIFNEWVDCNLLNENSNLYYNDILISDNDLIDLKKYFNNKFLEKIEVFSELNWNESISLRGKITSKQIDTFNKLRELIYGYKPIPLEEVQELYNKTSMSKELNSLFAIFRNDLNIYIPSTEKQMKYLNKLHRRVYHISNTRHKEFKEILDRRVASQKINEYLDLIKNNEISDDSSKVITPIVIDFSKYKNKYY